MTTMMPATTLPLLPRKPSPLVPRLLLMSELTSQTTVVVWTFLPRVSSTSSQQPFLSNKSSTGRSEHQVDMDRNANCSQHHLWHIHGFSTHGWSPRIPPLHLPLDCVRSSSRS